MSKPEGQPIICRGTRITVYPEWPGTVAAIRWNKYAGYTYGIRRDDDKRIFYVWESQIAKAMEQKNDTRTDSTQGRRRLDHGADRYGRS